MNLFYFYFPFISKQSTQVFILSFDSDFSLLDIAKKTRLNHVIYMQEMSSTTKSSVMASVTSLLSFSSSFVDTQPRLKDELDMPTRGICRNIFHHIFLD